MQAARYLGIPRLAAKNALAVVRHQLAPRRRHEFDAAVDALADHLNTVESLVNYGNRRGALAEWSLSTSDWASMTSGLRQRPEYARAGRWPNSPYVDWANEKRILASTWVWVRITSGEHLFAPPIRPDLDKPRNGRRLNSSNFSRWPLISADKPQGHWAELRNHLDNYADDLTELIDSNDSNQTIAIPLLRHHDMTS